MFRVLFFRFSRRRAVSTIIGGLIILTLILTALVTMVFVSQQYDQYQQSVSYMGQYDSQRLSEKLVFDSPGLTVLTSANVPGWGSGCTTTYNCYGMTVSNLGVGVQIVRIYINSTGPKGSGCSSPNPQPCILNPTLGIASYAFNQANQFVNPGEVNHVVMLALPRAVTLPNPNPAYEENSIIIATGRGNMFSFQWPIRLQVYGQSNSAFSSGIMEVAYTGTGTGSFDSANEPGHGGSGIATNGYCHNEPVGTGTGYAQKLTGITGGLGVADSGVLWFVNPWLTSTVLNSIDSTETGLGNTVLYILVIVTNTGQNSYALTAGSLDVFWYSAIHIEGNLIGVWYENSTYPTGKFYPVTSPASIAPGKSYYAIYQITTHYGVPSSGDLPVMFWGDASLTNGLGSNAEDQSYFSATVLLSGLWIRSSC